MDVLQGCTLAANMDRLEMQSCWILRVDLEQQALRQSLKEAGFTIPEPLKVVAKKPYVGLGLSFDEVWLILPKAEEADFLKQLKSALDGHHYALIENSAAYDSYYLKGDDSARLLSHLVAYDWFANNAGKVVGTMMQSVPLTIYQKPRDKGYYLMIRQSFSKYAEDFINHTAHAI